MKDTLRSFLIFARMFPHAFRGTGRPSKVRPANPRLLLFSLDPHWIGLLAICLFSVLLMTRTCVAETVDFGNFQIEWDGYTDGGGYVNVACDNQMTDSDYKWLYIYIPYSSYASDGTLARSGTLRFQCDARTGNTLSGQIRITRISTIRFGRARTQWSNSLIP
jgi:hypothetical protein